MKMILNLALPASLLLAGLVSSAAEPVDPSRSVVTQIAPDASRLSISEPRFRVIGYLGSRASLDAVPFEKLTHVNYAFLIPNDDGTFRKFSAASHLKETVRRAREAGVKVLISVGGWGWERQFEAMAEAPAKRAVFVRELLAFVKDHDLDGTDIDWEYPRPGGSAKNFLALMKELRVDLPTHKLLTAAVAALGKNADGIPDEALALLDFINLMAYDGPAGAHSSMEFAAASIDYWHARGLPPEKLVLGVPFYSRPGEVPYRKLVQADPSASNKDLSSYNGIEQNYNGIPTIQAKTRLAIKRGSGVMFWTLENDSDDDLSLLNAIFQTADGSLKTPAEKERWDRPVSRGSSK